MALEDTKEDDRILRSARHPIAHLALGPEGDRYLFRQRRERLQKQRRARATEASRALVSEAASSKAKATSAQQTTQASSSGSVGSTVAQTQSQSAGVMASQPLAMTPEEVAIQRAAARKAQLQQALGEIKAEKERMIRRRARMQRREANVSELEEMDLTHMSDEVRTIRPVLLDVVEMQDHQTALLQDIQQSLAVLVGRAQFAPSPSRPGAWPVAHPPPFVPPVNRVSPYTAPTSVQTGSLGMPLSGGISAGPSLQVPVQPVYSQPPLQISVTTQPDVSQHVQPQGTQPLQPVQPPVSQGPQPSGMQGPGQTQWVPETAIAAPKPFTGDKRGEDLDTWLKAVPVYVKCKLTLSHEEVLVAASYLEGSAAKWLSGLVQLQGYGHNFRSWAVTQQLDDFLKLVEERWHDPQEAQKATDAILTLHTMQLKSVREATDAVEHLICVPGVRYDPQVLLSSCLRCFPMPLRNQLAGEANINVHNFPSFSKKALEAKIGHGKAPTTDGRKKSLPPNWKAKGRIMFVDNDGSTIELEDNFQEGNYSIVAAPLTDLTRLDTPWEWTERCEAAFRHLKHALTHYEVLKLPDPDKPLIVTTDASQYGIGAVLAQQEGKKLRPVEYISKKMSSQKLAKSTYEKELYAVYKALTHWRHYLLGKFFIFRTDHQTLRWMRTQPVLSDTLKRWIEVIEQYDFEPQYIKGEYNKVADALTRRPDFSGALITEFNLADNVTQSLVEAYREDPFMFEIIRRLEAKDKGTSVEFELVNGLLFLEKVDWDEKLALIATLYNNVVHKATGVGPNSLLLTFRPRLPLDFLLPDNQPTAAPGTLKFAYRYEQLMQQAVEQMHKAQAAMIESENKHRRPSTFQVGERVWVKSLELGQEHGISRKLMPQYFGPWEVLDVVGNEPDGPSYVIRIPGHLRTYPVFHASKLAPFKETDQFPSRRSMLAPTMDGEVDIDYIVDHRELPVPRPTGRGRPPKPKLQYRVRFRHHLDPKEDRWFTREELMQTAPQIVAQYEKSLQKGKR
ncbi:hypothetical protein CBR_g41516 [Chara braunii]|uniref:Uncharacterized protein n=1 Tax=Chara braunii TaxID=69332 RepID=A0A388K2S0_CHABU|nr:hypothetical protein CBR_g41516 [Chara braunii]|eukprot:GBG64315.1 hypothetical protein CBR_g41516 [Chara braunii]